MDLGLERMWHGLMLIRRSVLFVVSNPILLIYAVCSFIVSYCLNFLFFHIKENLLLGSYSSSAELISDVYARIAVCSAIFTCIATCFTIFFLACLAHHAMHLLQHELSSAQETFAGVMRRWAPLSLWILIQVLIRSGGLIIRGLIVLPKYTDYTILVPLWTMLVCIMSYFFSIVLPIIATEQTGVLVALKRSCTLVWQFFMQFIGIFFIFSIAQIVAYTYLHNSALLILVKHLEMLTCTVFYYEYYARPKPELAEIFYPDV